MAIKSLVIAHVQGTYAWLDVLPKSGRRMIKTLCENAPFTPSRVGELHCTLVYSQESTIDNRILWNLPTPKVAYKATVKEVVRWPGHDGTGYVVALLDAPELQVVHEKYLDNGAKHSFPDYVPHVTLGVDVPDNFLVRSYLDRVNNLLQNDPLTVVLGNESTEPIRESL